MSITANERDYIFNSMESLLTKYNYSYSASALNKIIDTWETEKADLIEAFKKHPNYVEGQFMIAFSQDYERVLNADASIEFSEWLERGPIFRLKGDVPESIKERRRAEGCSCLPDKLYWFLVRLYNYAERCISEDTAEFLKEAIPEVRIRAKEKTSRVVNKICTYLGYHKDPNYNKEFAKYADSLSPMKIKRHTVLSLNPLDYLTMSFGNSWSSCHTIDKDNLRGMPDGYHGSASSGTISYMLDGCSMIFYTVDAEYDGNEYWNQPKINRQMFYWGEDKLIQGRLYPQKQDSCSDIYDPYRTIVQQIMSTIFNFPNLWTVKRDTCSIAPSVVSHGTHYRDYECFDSCTISRVKDHFNYQRITIGADPICIKCGRVHKQADNINCCSNPHICQCCGVWYDTSDLIEVNGVTLCRSCAE